jgi:GNAT superfamily N-acetyltransferase
LDDSFRLTLCSPADADLVRAVAIACYEPYYAGLWAEGGMAAYLAATYAPDRLVSELADVNLRYELAWQQDQPVAFLKTHERLDRPGVPNALYLERVYVTPEVLGRGVGRRLIEHALARARSLGRQWVWLQAMADAHHALASYRKLGFAVCDHVRLDVPRIRPERSAMVVMRRRP